MRTLFLTTLFSLILSAATVFAGDILVVQSMRVKPFEDALAGFRNVCDYRFKTVVLSDDEEIDIVRTVRRNRPDLILAIGAEALDRVKTVRDIPVIYLMVLYPGKITGEGKNIVGINMNIPPERYLALMQKLNPDRLKVGLFYDPENTGQLVGRILHTADAMDIEIKAIEVHTPREVPELFTRMKSDFDILWMLPDCSVVTKENVDYLLMHSRENGMPVITFAGKYVESGALASLDIDGFDLGKQAGEMAAKILSGAAVTEFSNADARKAVLRINKNVARNLGIKLQYIEASSYSN